MVKLLCMSDTHFDEDAVQKDTCDIFVHAGDFLGNGTLVEFLSFVNEIRDKIKYKYAILCPGNHDWICERDVSLCRGILNKNEFLLIDDAINLFNLKMYSCSYTPIFYDWAFMKKESELKEIFKRIPDDTDVLITHGPAYGILDKNYRGNCCGSHALLERIQEVKPKLHIFGHIHQSYGKRKYRGTKYINCSLLDDNYTMTNKPVIVEV